LEQFNAAHSYRLSAGFPSKTGQMEEYWVSCEEHEVPTEGMAVAGQSARTLKKMSLWSGSWYSAKEAGHTSIERETVLSDVYVVVIIRRVLGLKCLKRCHVQVLNESNCHSFITPDLLSPNSHDVNTINYVLSIESTRHKCRMWMIWGSVWLTCGLEWNRTLLRMPLRDHWCISMPAFEPEEHIMTIHGDTN